MAGQVTAATVDSGAASTAPLFKANGTEIGQLTKNWVNFNGVTTATVNASFNTSSITRNSAGDYTDNFTNNMADTKYSLAGFTTAASSTPINLYASGGVGTTPNLKSTSQFRIITQQFDSYDTSLQVFR